MHSLNSGRICLDSRGHFSLLPATSSIQRRIAAVFFATSLIIAATLAAIACQREYQSQLELTVEREHQIVEALRPSASRAAILKDSDLANAVLDALMTHPGFANATLKSIDGPVGSREVKNLTASQELRSYPLFAENDASRTIGWLRVGKSAENARQQAIAAAIPYSVILLAQIVASGVLLLLLINRWVCLPLRQLTQQIEDASLTVDPTLHVSVVNEHDEIGRLLDSSNTMLKACSQAIVEQRRLRAEVQAHHDYLEALIVDRENALLVTREAALVANKSYENEERFRHAFLQSPIGMILCSLEGRVFRVNPAFSRLSGYDETELINRRLGDVLLSEPVAIKEIMLFHKIANGEIANFSIQQEQLHKDGHRYVVGNSVTVIRNNHDEPLYCIAHLEDMTERHRQQLEALAMQTLKALERERSRLSRELHDEIGQSLTALKLNLQRVQRIAADDLNATAKAGLLEATEAIDRLTGEIRSIAYALRPSQLDELGLLSSLRWYVDRLTKPPGLSVVLSGNLGEHRLPPDLELCCFRVAQESLTNVLRYSQASEVCIRLNRYANTLIMEICDNGIGFDVLKFYISPENIQSLGLIGMRERVAANGGRLEIFSRPGQGVNVSATFNLSS